jgi:hypothetical protein
MRTDRNTISITVDPVTTERIANGINTGSGV